MENEKIKGVFIPLEIWNIKNLNINEKLILSDIYNKEKQTEKKEYNTKAETLKEFLNIEAFTVKDIFNTLQKKGYILSNPEIHRNQGNFKKSISRRHIIQDNFLNAVRFKIPDDNIFLRNGKKGIFFNLQDIFFLNSWNYSKNRKAKKEDKQIKLSSKTRNKHLILILIIRKISFFHNNNLFARFKIKDIVEFTGIERKTTAEYIKILTNKDLYGQTEIRFLYKLSDIEAYNELFNKLKDTPILTDYKSPEKEIEVITAEGETEKMQLGNMDNLYFINLDDMEKMGINTGNLINNKK